MVLGPFCNGGPIPVPSIGCYYPCLIYLPPNNESERSEKVGLKLNIQKTKIMTSGPITSWQIDGETMKTVTDFIFWAPKSLQMVTAAMKLKDAYSLGVKIMTNLDSI